MARATPHGSRSLREPQKRGWKKNTVRTMGTARMCSQCDRGRILVRWFRTRLSSSIGFQALVVPRETMAARRRKNQSCIYRAHDRSHNYACFASASTSNIAALGFGEGHNSWTQWDVVVDSESWGNAGAGHVEDQLMSSSNDVSTSGYDSSYRGTRSNDDSGDGNGGWRSVTDSGGDGDGSGKKKWNVSLFFMLLFLLVGTAFAIYIFGMEAGGEVGNGIRYVVGGIGVWLWVFISYGVPELIAAVSQLFSSTTVDDESSLAVENDKNRRPDTRRELDSFVDKMDATSYDSIDENMAVSGMLERDPYSELEQDRDNENGKIGDDKGIVREEKTFERNNFATSLKNFDNIRKKILVDTGTSIDSIDSASSFANGTSLKFPPTYLPAAMAASYSAQVSFDEDGRNDDDMEMYKSENKKISRSGNAKDNDTDTSMQSTSSLEDACLEASHAAAKAAEAAKVAFRSAVSASCAADLAINAIKRSQFDEALVAAAEATEASKWAADYSNLALRSSKIALTIEKRTQQCFGESQISTGKEVANTNRS